MKKFLLGVSVLVLTFIKTAYAVCPLCTVVVGAGVGFAQWFGIDDSITGLWIGGLTVSLIIWTIDWLNRRNICFKGRKIVTILIYYIILVAPLYYPLHIIGHPLNKLWGVDRLLLGITIGSILFAAGAVSYSYMKVRNDGHAYFPFQKVIQPIAPLLIMSVVFYFITKYY
ncbi:MAG: hypothetical protein PVG30_05445 [Gammaproteobacteria bacterium]|jgi:hypothetical protein